MGRKRKSSFVSDTSTASFSESYDNNNSQLYSSNNCSQSSQLSSDVFKRLRMSDSLDNETINIESINRHDDLQTSTYINREDENLIRYSSTPIHDKYIDADLLNTHFSQFEEEAFQELLHNNSSDESNENKSIGVGSKNYNAINIDDHFSNLNEENLRKYNDFCKVTGIGHLSSKQLNEIIIESQHSSDINVHSDVLFKHFGQTSHKINGDEVDMFSPLDVSDEALLNIPEALNHTYNRIPYTMNGKIEDDQANRAQSTNSFSFNENDVNEHFSQLLNMTFNTTLVSSTNDEDVIPDNSITTFENINENELNEHFSQLPNMTFNTTLISSTSENVIPDNSNTTFGNINENELIEHFSQLQNMTFNTTLMSSTNGEDVIPDNSSTTFGNINENELTEHFSHLPNLTFNMTLMNSANGEDVIPDDLSTTFGNINEKEPNEHFSQLPNMTFNIPSTSSRNESVKLDNSNVPFDDNDKEEFDKRSSQLTNKTLDNTSEDLLQIHNVDYFNETLKNITSQHMDNSVMYELQMIKHSSQLQSNNEIVLNMSAVSNEKNVVNDLCDNLEENSFKQHFSQYQIDEFNNTNAFVTSSEGEDLLNESSKVSETHIVGYNKKVEILKDKLQSVLLWFIDTVIEERSPVFTVRSNLHWNNCLFENNILSFKPNNDLRYIKIKFHSRNGRSKFSLILYLLAKMYSLLLTKSTCTQREIYYQLKNYVGSQAQIAVSLNNISSLLYIEPWNLPIVSTSKSLVFGDLTLISHQKEVISCSVHGDCSINVRKVGRRLRFLHKDVNSLPNLQVLYISGKFERNADLPNSKQVSGGIYLSPIGILIPEDIKRFNEFKSNASFVLIVEKDTIFKRLLNEGLLNKLNKPFILITGKGYPDVNARLFIKTLHKNLQIPIFILVDADYDGINIMLTYRFGSLHMAHLSEQLAVPEIRWLGILPSEIHTLNITHQPLTEHDQIKLHKMLKRPYIDANPWLKRELEILQGNGVKAEIEGIIKSKAFLTDVYLPSKLQSEDHF